MLARLVLQGLRGSKKLKHGALSLYMGNGMRAAIEAIGVFDLILPSGLIIVLDNCHFAPTITRGVVSISRLVENGYPDETLGYYFYYPPENKIFVARNAEFFENSLIIQEASGSHGPLKMRDLNEPPNYKAALSDPEYDKWLEAMNMEMQSMKDNQVWILVELPPNGRTVRSKWIFKKKTDMDSNVNTFKAHLVAKGYTQTYGVDYGETFSPVADIRAIRILLAIVVFYDYEIWKMDVKTAFLKCHLSEDNKRFDVEIKKIGFTQNLDEPCVYLKASGSSVAFLILYVDDILLMGNNVTMLKEVKSWLSKCFSMKDLGKAAYVLRIKIIHDRSKQLIALSQSAYLEKILKRFMMENSKKMYTPMMEKPDYRKSQGARTPSEVQRMQRVPYDSAIGSIMYAVRYTRPDVAFAQNLYSYFQQNPEAEYFAAAEASMEAVWMRKFINRLGDVVPSNKRPMEMLCDNEPAITIATNPYILKGVRHFQRKYHYIREVT
ncbi:retrotransposon protein, putative, ty1-copia subclass [Tanacetum coccineum]